MFPLIFLYTNLISVPLKSGPVKGSLDKSRGQLSFALWLYLDIHREQLPFLACVLKINQDKHPILGKLSFFEF